VVWTSLDFHNGFREHKFFDLRIEHISNRSGELAMIIARPRLHSSLEKAIKGFRLEKLDAKTLARLADEAKKAGAMSEFVHNLATGFEDPVLL
jgi:hypothetical protein